MTPNSRKAIESFWCDLWLQVRTWRCGKDSEKVEMDLMESSRKVQSLRCIWASCRWSCQGLFLERDIIDISYEAQMAKEEESTLVLAIPGLRTISQRWTISEEGGIGSPGLQQSARKLETAGPANLLIRDIYGKISKLNNS